MNITSFFNRRNIFKWCTRVQPEILCRIKPGSGKEASSIGRYPDRHFRSPPNLLEYKYCPGSIRQVTQFESWQSAALPISRLTPLHSTLTLPSYFLLILQSTFLWQIFPPEFCTHNFSHRPASWSSGQGLWLLIMRSRFRFPVLPWEFVLAGKDSRGDHGMGS